MQPNRPKQKGITFGYCDEQSGQRIYLPITDDATATLQTTSPSLLTQEQKPKVGQHWQIEGGMYLQITCSPPLGRVTQIARSEQNVRFTVLVEIASGGELLPKVCVWHNHVDADVWTDLELDLDETFNARVISTRDNTLDSGIVQRWYVGEINGPPRGGSQLHFTVKVKIRPDEEWRWVKDLTGDEDGHVIYTTSNLVTDSDSSFDTYFEHVDADIPVRRELPETVDTMLFSAQCPVEAANGDKSAYSHLRLGRPRHAVQWFASVRLWSPWLAPRHGKGHFNLDRDGVLLAFQRTDGLHVVCLAISGLGDIVTTFQSDSEGNVIVQSRNDGVSAASGLVLIAVADSFDVANAAVFYHARKTVSALDDSPPNRSIGRVSSDDIKSEWYEEWFDGLAYCTWNGLGQNLTAEKVYDALSQLAEHDINVTNLIIDDNWQSLGEGSTQFKRGWTDFEANDGFPGGLKATTAEIRRRFPNINHIAVWHAMFGYWGGISPHGDIAKKYKTREVTIEPGVAEGTMTVVANEDIQVMYDDFYRFLSASGVDSVKTDAQFFLDMLLHAPDRRALIKEYQDAWTLAHLRHLSGRAISCMSQTPQIMFHNQLPMNRSRMLVRNSDDFFPDVAASHPWHVFCNAHNTLFMEHLNVLPDWDMFQTSHEWASFHAAARCVSGGPIYITDRPGHHNIELIKQMTAQTTRERTIVLRPDRVGKTTNPYNHYESGTLLKIGNYVGSAQTGTGFLGIFNVSQNEHKEVIRLADIPGTYKGEYIISSFVTGQISLPISQSDATDLIVVELASRGWDIFTAYAVHTLGSGDQSCRTACLGLMNKMTGAAAVTGYTVRMESNKRLRWWVSLKALGVLGIWLSDLEKGSIESDLLVTIYGSVIPTHCVAVNRVCNKILEIDVARAWQEMGFQASWSNEVSVEVFVNQSHG